MSDPDLPGGRLSSPGHHYQHIQVSEGARAQLGDTYHISKLVLFTEMQELTHKRP